MDNHYGYHTDHPLVKLLNLMDNVLSLKQVGDETIQEMWLKFQVALQTYPTHGMTNKALQERFYWGLGRGNKSNVDILLHQWYPKPAL